MRLALERFALFMVSNALRAIPLRMVPQISLWYVILSHLIRRFIYSEKTSMFVPDPVVSLSLKPQGQESPNFSRALNRFKKEDPTFRVHVDPESKEVCPKCVIL